MRARPANELDGASIDPRRRIPRTDDLLALPELQAARASLSDAAIRSLVTAAQQRARRGEIAPEEVAPQLIAGVARARGSSLTPVLNATGVIVHTNLGRAPLSDTARAAVADAAGYADVELDLATGKRGTRGAGAKAALLEACPQAEDALVVNNGAAALLLAVTATTCVDTSAASPARQCDATARDVVVSRGELVEIGAGFRLPDLMESTGARLREVGTTNRTHVSDYAAALHFGTGCVVKIHPSNFYIDGFTSGVEVAALRSLLHEHAEATGYRVPLIVDLGSGLLEPDAALPQEPDIASALRAGADIVIASGDKLLGGPQAGLILGSRELVQRLATHPLARAVRADKLAIAALEATLRGVKPPVRAALHIDSAELKRRTETLAKRFVPHGDHSVRVVPHDGRVGGGGAPGVPLPGWALELPEVFAPVLRSGTPAVLARLSQGRCLIDLRCIPASEDERVLEALITAVGQVAR